MIAVATFGGAKTTAQILGGNVVAFVCVCPSEAAAQRLLGRFSRRLSRRGPAAIAARAPVQPDPADPFGPGQPARLSVHDWDRGEAAIDVTILRRISPTRLEVRTRLGRVTQAHQADLERGRRTS